MAKLVTLFGLLRIEENGKLSAVMKNQKGCALLIYLLLTQKRHSREALADLLWEAKTTEDSLRNLRQLLSRVRKRLPELEITRDWIGLKEDAELNVDLYKLEAGLVGEDLNQQAAALQLYTGELLSGFYLSDATHFAEWLIIEQERLHRRVLGHFPVLCQALLAARAWQKGVEVARHWLTVDDLDEEGHRYLMRFLAAAGQTAAALAQYQSLCQLYEEELGVEPAEQTTALYEKLATEAHHFEQETAVIPHTPRQNKWGEAPNPIAFYGREAELAQLTEWLVPQQARLVTILGIGGQGKTALAAMTARSLADQFEGVYWRSLINAPPLHIILPDIISFFSHNQKLPPENLAEQLEMVRRLIEHNRFLLVLDNVETILDGKIAGKFRPSYADYEQLLQLFGQGGHQSCLLLTSREAPSALNRLAQQSARVKTLQLSGLGESASSDLFAAGQIEASDETVLTLAKRYSGNPLALKLVTQTIQDFYFGEAAAFLDEETLIFDDIRDVLDQQFQRLSLLEQSILIWLAIIRVATPPQMLAKLLNEPVRQRELLEAMKRLQRRSLLEREHKGFGLQNVVTEYLTDHIVETVSFEIKSGRLDYAQRFALILADAREYIRQSQERMILRPIRADLEFQLGTAVSLHHHFATLITQIRQRPAAKLSYAAGNMLNLLRYMDIDLTGFDFSHLTIRQAYLRGATLIALDLSGTHLADMVFTSPLGVVQAVAFSPDNRFLATGSTDGVIRLWRVEDARLEATMTDDTDTFITMSFSSDGRTLTTSGNDGVVRIWDMTKRQLRHRLVEHEHNVWAVPIHPSGRVAASASDDRTIRLWDIESGECTHVLRNQDGQSHAVAFSPDGRWMAGGGDDNVVHIWDFETMELRQRLRGHGDWIGIVAFSPNGRLLASASLDLTIRIWDLATGEVRHTLTGHSDMIRALVFSPDGQTLVSSSQDTTLRIWDVQKGQIRQVMPFNVIVWAAAFSSDGQMLAASTDDYKVRLWETKSMRSVDEAHLRTIIQGHNSTVWSIAFSPDGQLLASGGFDKKLRVWNTAAMLEPEVAVNSGQAAASIPANVRAVRYTVASNLGHVRHVGFSLDSQLLVRTGYQTIQVLDAYSGEIRYELQGHQGGVSRVSFSPNGRYLVSSGSDSAVYLWDLYAKQGQRIIKYDRGGIYDNVFSPDGQLLVTSDSENRIHLWDISLLLNTTTTNFFAPTIPTHGNTSDCVVITARTLAAAEYAPASQLNIEHHKKLKLKRRIFDGHIRATFGLAFSSDGALFISCSHDGTIRLWDVAAMLDPTIAETDFGTDKMRADGENRLVSQATHHVLHGHDGWVWHSAISPQDNIVASAGSDKTVRLWDVKTGQATHVLHGHTGWVLNLAFSPDGQIVASTGMDETIRFWDTQTGNCLQMMRVPGPYEGMKIGGITGVSEAQRGALKALGAV